MYRPGPGRAPLGAVGRARRLGFLAAKRTFDVVVASALLAALSPLFVVVAVVVRARLGRPVLFRQLRPGYQGRCFTVLKFRTMTDARGPDGELLPDEERMDAVGSRLRSMSLDELPQLINILRGEMTFVGPRPLLVEYLGRYSPEQARRHDAKPGLTGYAQVHGRQAVDWAERLRLDVYYVEHRSLRLDLEIIGRTVGLIARREGIAMDGFATGPEFMGND